MSVEITRKTVNEPLAALEKQHGPEASKVVRAAHITEVATAAAGEVAQLTKDIEALPDETLKAFTTPAAMLARLLTIEKRI